MKNITLNLEYNEQIIKIEYQEEELMSEVLKKCSTKAKLDIGKTNFLFKLGKNKLIKMKNLEELTELFEPITIIAKSNSLIINFIYKQKTYPIVCKNDDLMSDIIKNISSKIGKKPEDIYFLASGNYFDIKTQKKVGELGIKDYSGVLIYNFLKNNIENENKYNIDPEFMILPEKLKFKEIISNNNDGNYGENDIFEVYKSIKDQKEYLVTKNPDTKNLDLIELKENKFIKSLVGHNNNITTIRYFTDNSKEYLISADKDKKVIVWNISNDYNKMYIIDTKYEDKYRNIYSCLLIFNINNNKKDYIVTSINKQSNNIEKSSSKLYRLEDGLFLRNINNSNSNETFYLLQWKNKSNDEDYIIELCSKKIVINNIEKNELYSELIMENESKHYCGFIYTENENDYLISSSGNGFIVKWDLYNKTLESIIDTQGCNLRYIIRWSNKYVIVVNRDNRSLKIVDLNNKIVVKDIGDQHLDWIICVKKIVHPKYGESLLSAGCDQKIILWTK